MTILRKSLFLRSLCLNLLISTVNLIILLGASKFKQSFNDAKEFNVLKKSGENDKLVYAPIVKQSSERINMNLKREARSLSFCCDFVRQENIDNKF